MFKYLRNKIHLFLLNQRLKKLNDNLMYVSHILSISKIDAEIKVMLEYEVELISKKKIINQNIDKLKCIS